MGHCNAWLSHHYRPCLEQGAAGLDMAVLQWRLEICAPQQQLTASGLVAE